MVNPALVFFSLTAARNGRIPDVPQPRIEGRGFKSGYVCAALPSQYPWSRINSVITAGNKFGRPQVRKFEWGCVRTLFECNSTKMKRTFLGLHGVTGFVTG